MCGITGAFDRSHSISAVHMERALATMTSQILHRGPDAGRVEIVGPVGLGHRRLAVIDLNPHLTPGSTFFSQDRHVPLMRS